MPTHTLAHNSLRRDLSAAIADTPETWAIKGILTRALTALGGPVEDKRPQMVTAVPQADGDNTPLVGRDTGDETDAKEAPRVPLFFTTNVIIDDEPRD